MLLERTNEIRSKPLLGVMKGGKSFGVKPLVIARGHNLS